MFNFIINLPSSLCGFISGILISISTTALGNFILVPNPPPNIDTLKGIAILSFGGSLSWIVLAEVIQNIKTKIERNMDGINGKPWEKYAIASQTVRKSSSNKIYVSFCLTLLLSFSWIVFYYYNITPPSLP